jgi:threonylcarbamoyladenosine tRNA methylthiotransferase MtaB
VGRSTPDLPHFAELEKYIDASGGQERTRAMVKAQDGCDSHCTYCIIPRARGRSRSLTPEDVLTRVRSLVAEGHVEIVLTGVDLGSYGEDDHTVPDLGGLLERILEETDVARVRVSSLEPGDFNPDWLGLWKSPRLCRHLHVPLQAGSAGVLQRMERRYSPQGYAAMVTSCREAIPGVTITTDVMVGFPGESDGDFDEGYHFIRSMRFDGMHVFKYSQRSGTRAARLPDQVPEPIKAQRAALLREEAVAGVERLLQRHLHGEARVAWESERDGILRGLSDTNVRTYGSAVGLRPDRLTRMRCTGPFADGLWSEPIHADITLMAVG